MDKTLINDLMTRIKVAVKRTGSSQDMVCLQGALETAIQVIGCYRCEAAAADERSKQNHRERAHSTYMAALEYLDKINGKTGP